MFYIITLISKLRLTYVSTSEQYFLVGAFSFVNLLFLNSNGMTHNVSAICRKRFLIFGAAYLKIRTTGLAEIGLK